MKSAAIATCAVATLLSYSAVAQISPKSCQAQHCKVGDLVRTYSTKAEPATACATQALTEYVAFMFGLAVFGIGEDQIQGDTAAAANSLKKAAGVSSLKEAALACWIPKMNEKLIILEIPADSTTAKVAPTNGRAPFWITYSHLDIK